MESGGVTIVGIGASAGGLGAFEAFFSAMPANTDPGMAFVLIQHLAPDHKSLLRELVSRYTAMPVLEAEDGMRVEANTVYIIPPNRDMSILHGSLQLFEPTAARGLRLPIDFFFRALAEDQHDRAIGIVLSGTASDGTLGARAIKGEGGMVMAQSPDSTEHDGMPRSAIATGMVDYILPPADMPEQLIAFVSRRFGGTPEAITPGTSGTEDALKKILVLLRSRTGHDFSQYKESTVLRRIERRMAVHQIAGLADYVRYMRDVPAEAEALFGDLLIGVTCFFRDAEAFAALEGEVAHLFDDTPAGATIRVWCAGCSTGEEAYSIAILLQERMQALKQTYTIQFFATDVDRRAIDVARAGVYPANIVADVSPERLLRFFTREPTDGSYRIHKSLRDMLVFSEHDVIRDPPFSRLDLISCRNLLIYMGLELHHKLIPLFHYALKPKGALLLGTSETVGEFGDLFAALNRKTKLYRRKEGDFAAFRPSLDALRSRSVARARRPDPTTRAGTTARLRALTEQTLLQQDHIGALVTARGDLLYLHGRGRLFELAPGEAAMNVLTMAREGLRGALTMALHSAVAQKVPVSQTGLVVQTDAGRIPVTLTVRPVDGGSTAEAESGLFVVILEEGPALAATPPPAVAPAPGDTDDARIAALTQELRAKEEYLQTTNEELATSNEELRSSNEEMQSVNEELQSANEELETSKEELQSMNEELATVNAELQTRLSDLARANNDLNNLLAGTGMGTVFVDHQLRIQRFTPAITQVINLIQTDLGRPVGHIASNLVGYDSFVQDIQSVLDQLTPKEVEVQTREGAWFLLRIRPYRTLENVIEGAVITFTDITEMKQARTALIESEGLRRLAIVVRDSHDAILVQALDGRILAWSPGAERAYGWTETEALAMNIRALIPESEQDASFQKVHELAHASRPAPYLANRLTKGGKAVAVWLTAAALVDEAGTPYAIATTERARE